MEIKNRMLKVRLDYHRVIGRSLESAKGKSFRCVNCGEVLGRKVDSPAELIDVGIYRHKKCN